MANLGLGIGSFISGLAQGAGIARQWDKDDLEAKYKDRQMKLLEGRESREANKDLREIATSEEDRAFKREDRARATTEYEANKPVREVQRKSIINQAAEFEANAPVREAQRRESLGSLSDAEASRGERTAERETKKAAAEAAKTGFASGKYKSYTEAFRAEGLPMLEQDALSRGDTARADLYKNWGNDKRIEGGLESFGKMDTAASIGDWSAFDKNLNDLWANRAYMADTGHELKTSPIEVNGKIAGLRITTKNKETGEESTKDFTDMGEVALMARNILNPKAALEWSLGRHQAKIDATAKRGEERNKLADQIELEGVKGENAIRAGAARASGNLDVALAKGASAERVAGARAQAKGETLSIKDALTYLSTNVPGFARLPQEQQIAQAQQLQQRAAGGGAQPGGAPAQAVPNRGVAPPAQAAGAPSSAASPATPRSIMPAAAPISRQPTVDEQYAAKYGFPPDWTQDQVDEALRLRQAQSYMR